MQAEIIRWMYILRTKRKLIAHKIKSMRPQTKTAFFKVVKELTSLSA